MVPKQTKATGIIVGGSGLIGGTLVHYFNTHHPDDISILSPNSKKMSLEKADEIKHYICQWKPDFIINSAIAAIDADPQLAYNINYIGNINLARICRELQIPYIFISSAAVLPSGKQIGEDDQLKLQPTLSNYAKSKLMGELTLQHMAKTEGLDFTAIRLAVVYGKHDHKTQGFHRMLYSIADGAMPLYLTAKGVQHSYSNAKKIPFFIDHILQNRKEFSGQFYNFADPEPVELVQLIKTIKSYLGVAKPRNVYLPLATAKIGVNCLRLLLKVLLRVGIDARMPAELMFLQQFYQSQTLLTDKLQNSSFQDPWPEQTIYSKLPEIIEYYISRWEQRNLITGFNDDFFVPFEANLSLFMENPEELLKQIHSKERKIFCQYPDGKERKN